MTVSPDARTPSADLHTLSGSSRPGAAPTVQPFMVVTAQAANLDDTFVPLDGAALDVVAGLAGRRSAVDLMDSEVTDLGTRLATLARRHHAVWGRRASIKDAISLEIGSRPEQPVRSDQAFSYRVEECDDLVVGTITRSARIAESEASALVEHQAAMAAHAQRETEAEARRGLPQLEKLCERQARRLIRWTERLTSLAPRSQAALAAKASALLALQETDTAGRWVAALAKSVSRDAVRIAAALAAEGDPDAELHARGRAWAASCLACHRTEAAYYAACDRLQRPEVPEEVFFRSGDQRLYRGFGPYGSEHLPSGRYWHGDPSSLDALRKGAVSGSVAKPEVAERRAEILTAHERWRAAVRADEEASGYAVAREQDEAAAEENGRLRRAILATPALTMEGLAVKLRVAAWCYGSADELAGDLQAAAAVAPASGETAAISILLDLVRMDERRAKVSEPKHIARAA